MEQPRQQRPCLFYAVGLGDIVQTLTTWQSGVDDSHQVAMTYSRQFFLACSGLQTRFYDPAYPWGAKLQQVAEGWS